jgi:hypothetical protein
MKNPLVDRLRMLAGEDQLAGIDLIEARHRLAQDAVLQQLAQQVPGFPPLVVPASRVTVEEAVATYLFNRKPPLSIASGCWRAKISWRGLT